jgi:hypothetical protein
MLTSTALNPNWSLLEKVLPQLQAPPFPPPARALAISLLYPTTRKLFWIGTMNWRLALPCFGWWHDTSSCRQHPGKVAAAAAAAAAAAVSSASTARAAADTAASVIAASHAAA